MGVSWIATPLKTGSILERFTNEDAVDRSTRIRTLRESDWSSERCLGAETSCSPGRVIGAQRQARVSCSGECSHGRDDPSNPQRASVLSPRTRRRPERFSRSGAVLRRRSFVEERGAYRSDVTLSRGNNRVSQCSPSLAALRSRLVLDMSGEVAQMGAE
jgi:hypothetical protein